MDQLLPPPLNLDLINIIFSYLKPYSPLLRLVNKQWKMHFTNAIYPNKEEIFFKELIDTEDISLLEFVYQFGKPYQQSICEVAAEAGSIKVLKWAREKNIPWGDHTCAAAAGEGHLDLLIWLKENGCPWDKQTLEKAAEKGHQEILEWAKNNGCPDKDENEMDLFQQNLSLKFNFKR